MNTYKFIHTNSNAVLILPADDIEEAWEEFENIIQIENIIGYLKKQINYG